MSGSARNSGEKDARLSNGASVGRSAVSPPSPAVSPAPASDPALRVRCTLVIVAAWVVLLVASLATAPHDQAARGAAYGLVFVVAGLALLWIRGANRPFAILVTFLVALSLLRIASILSGTLDLSGDEAHYWEWSRRPDVSYYSKPPGVAYLIMLSANLFGNTPLGVRSLSVALCFLAGLAMYRLASHMHGAKVGALAAAVMQVIPLFALYGVGMTPDTPLLLFWTLSLLTLHWAWESGKGGAWIALGLALGLGLLGKLAILFFYVPAMLFLLSNETGRKRLRTPWPYIALGASLFFLLPVLVWNIQHGWVTLRHDLVHAKVNEGWVLSPLSLGDFIGSQLAVITPVILVMMIYALVKRRKTDQLCFWLTVPILAGFAIKSMQGKVQANWALSGYVAGVIPFAAVYLGGFSALGKHMRRLVAIGVGIAVVATAVSLYPSVVGRLGLPPKLNPATRLNGWKTLGREATALEASIGGKHFVFSDNYMISSELAFYMEGHPFTYCVNLGRRMNQYDVWPGFENLTGQDALYVSTRQMPASIAAAFAATEPRQIVIRDAKGREIKKYEAYLCYGFRGMATRAPVTY
jgi:4-amino-4-deoxy-L-arabinose transferase-like glycosyltransferase